MLIPSSPKRPGSKSKKYRAATLEKLVALGFFAIFYGLFIEENTKEKGTTMSNVKCSEVVTPNRSAYDVHDITTSSGYNYVRADVGVQIRIDLDYMMDFIVEHWSGLDTTKRHEFARKVGRLSAIDDYKYLKGELHKDDDDDDKEFMW